MNHPLTTWKKNWWDNLMKILRRIIKIIGSLPKQGTYEGKMT